jgi:Guanosine polyphosphate pyrophosphohydrolases/synthetases
MIAPVDRARAIAEEAHAGQIKRKTGEPVLRHVARVAAAVSKEDEKIVAWLHDVVESAPDWSLDRLRSEGFADGIIAAVDALTKREDESHPALVMRAAGNALARSIKEADLRDNLAAARKAGADTAKYEEGLRLLNRRTGTSTDERSS